MGLVDLVLVAMSAVLIPCLVVTGERMVSVLGLMAADVPAQAEMARGLIPLIAVIDEVLVVM